MKTREIVASTVIAGALLTLIQCAGPTGPTPADLVLVNGNVITVDADFKVAQALAIRAGHIVALGTNADVDTFVGPDTERVDLQGRTVTPGFIDGHPHVFAMQDVSLEHVESAAEIRVTIEEEAAQRQPGEWIVLEPPGAPPYHFHMPDRLAEGRWPTLVELDRAAPDNPVYIKSSPFHKQPTQLFNSAALTALGITIDSDPINGARVVRDDDGAPTGEVIGNMSYFSQSPLRDRLWALSPEHDMNDQLAELQRDIAAYHAGGVTGIYEGHGMPDSTIALYAELRHRGELTMRTYLVKTVSQFAPLEVAIKELDRMAEIRGSGLGDDILTVGGVGIIFGDNVGFGAGFMHQPYVGHWGQPWQGLQLIDDDKMLELLRAAAERNIRVNFQASGSLAIEKVLGAFDRINEDIPITDRRWVLIHCQFPSTSDMDRAARLGVIPTTVTNFLWGQGNAYLRYYAEELSHSAVPLKRWLEHDVPVVQSTDYGPNGAMFTLWQSLARHNGWTGEALGADQTISREQALRLYTINGARLMFAEDVIGSLEPGKYADLVVLDRDILSVALEEIRDTRVLATLVDGRVVHGSLGPPTPGKVL